MADIETVFKHEGRAREFLAANGYGNEFDLLEDDTTFYVAGFTRDGTKYPNHERAEMVVGYDNDMFLHWTVTQKDNEL